MMFSFGAVEMFQTEVVSVFFCEKGDSERIEGSGGVLSCTCAARLALVRKVVGIVNISDTSHWNDDDDDDDDDDDS